MAARKENIGKALGLLKLLSHPVRLSLLCDLLHRKEMSVGEIVAASGGSASQSQISQFLRKMKDEGLVACRRDGQTIYYRIVSREARQLVHTLFLLYCGK